MTDAETIEAAKRLFASDTPGDKLGRRLLAIAERATDTASVIKAASDLRDEMECTSEECVAAGWMYSLEYILWEAIETGQTTWANGTIDTVYLSELSDRCGGWWVWDDGEPGPRFVSLTEWAEIRAKRNAK